MHEASGYAGLREKGLRGFGYDLGWNQTGRGGALLKVDGLLPVCDSHGFRENRTCDVECQGDEMDFFFSGFETGGVDTTLIASPWCQATYFTSNIRQYSALVYYALRYRYYLASQKLCFSLYLAESRVAEGLALAREVIPCQWLKGVALTRERQF
jgi:hypothetical protein